MSLPPEQINIKRRREEEPVDTLYIQSELHQTKRRFTDFVFQRVQVKGHGPKGTTSGTSSSPPPLASGQQRVIHTPRSVSSCLFPSSTAAADGGVPLVRATSPGAEFREERRLAAARREHDEKLKRALHSSPGPSTSLSPAGSRSPALDSGAAGPTAAASSGHESPASSSSAAASQQSLRRFQISRSSTPINSTLRGTGAGVQKRKGDGPVAILVEKLRRKPHSRQASFVADAVAGAEGLDGMSSSGSGAGGAEEAVRPRKRPVVNQAERKWREERKSAISAAKQHISQVLDQEAQASHQSTWEDESERLAKELEQVALELDAEMEVDMQHAGPYSPQSNIGSSTFGGGQPSPSHSVGMPKPPLKYQPRTPNKHRPTQKPRGGSAVQDPHSAATATDALPAEQDDDEESDGEYVYDTYIRKPLPVSGMLTDPLANLESDHDAWFKQHGIDMTRQDIGVIVITQEDEEYWENFAEEEEDEERWDSEDADSNAENNPANDYPDEELSWDDEEDATAIYSKYRIHARSDDEEFDFDDSGSEGRRRFDYGLRSHVESDEESW